MTGYTCVCHSPGGTAAAESLGGLQWGSAFNTRRAPRSFLWPWLLSSHSCQSSHIRLGRLGRYVLEKLVACKTSVHLIGMSESWHCQYWLDPPPHHPILELWWIWRQRVGYATRTAPCLSDVNYQVCSSLCHRWLSFRRSSHKDCQKTHICELGLHSSCIGCWWSNTLQSMMVDPGLYWHSS